MQPAEVRCIGAGTAADCRRGLVCEVVHCIYLKNEWVYHDSGSSHPKVVPPVHVAANFQG
jgi:hypothetical protein